MANEYDTLNIVCVHPVLVLQYMTWQVMDPFVTYSQTDMTHIYHIYSYLIGVGRLGEVDAISDEFIPDHDLQLQLRVNYQLSPVAQRQVPLRTHVPTVASNPFIIVLGPRLGSPQFGFILVHHVTGINLSCGWHRLQSEVQSTGCLFGFLL